MNNQVFMGVQLQLRDKKYTVKAGLTVCKALEQLNIPSESVLATRNGELITEDEVLKEGDLITLVAVISGGSICPLAG